MTERNIGSLFRIFYLHLFSDGVKVDSCYLIAISKKNKKKNKVFSTYINGGFNEVIPDTQYIIKVRVSSV